jgi:LmbE family N-acetylglucosaminyl deacetylase
LTRGDGPPRLLAVVAHPDDETFGCGSLLLHAAASGAQTWVACATRGEAGQSAIPDPGPGGLGALRERELRDAATLLGVSGVVLLDYVDSGMVGLTDPASLVAAPLRDVARRVAAVIDEVCPDVIVTLDAGDGHRDHERIREATLAAVRAASWRTPRVYLQCLPQSLMRAWLAHVSGADPGSEHLLIDVPGTPDEDITTVIDTRNLLAARRRAIAAHRSQHSPFDGIPEPLAEAFLASDRLRRVVPPWTGGIVESDVFPDGRAAADIR